MHALDKIGKGDLRVAVAFLTEEGAPVWAALQIQSRFRGNCDRTEIQHQHVAAIKIQTKTRAKQQYKVGRLFMKEARAARRIQARQRGNLQRQKDIQEKAGATRIQSAARGRQAKALRLRMMRNKSVQIMNFGFKTRNCVSKQRNFVLTMSNVCSGATVLQSLARRHVARMGAKKSHVAGIRMQKHFRGWRTRKMMRELVAETQWYEVCERSCSLLLAGFQSGHPGLKLAPCSLLLADLS